MGKFQRSETPCRSEASQSRCQQEHDQQRIQRHEGEEHKWEIFLKCPAIHQLENDEWHNKDSTDQQRSDRGLEGSKSGLICIHSVV